MLIILSPAKTLNYKNDSPTQKCSQPIYINQAKQLVDVLRSLSPANLRELMDINTGIAELNHMRFGKWQPEHYPDNSKQAVFAFNGEVYNGLKALTMSDKQIEFAQNHLRILSGLYGMLRPLDLIQPYRLEMCTNLSFDRYNNLYDFWGDTINKALNEELSLQDSKFLINLASNEYSKAAILKKINARVITPVFKEFKGNEYKIITVYAKKARGYMSRFIIDNEIETPEDIKAFDIEGYAYTENLSTENEWVFTR